MRPANALFLPTVLLASMATPCCDKTSLKRGKWTAEEDEKLINYIKANGDGSWRSLPKNAGLLRCGKSCRLRWINYLRDDVKRGNFSEDEEEMIVKLHNTLGNKWSLIASHLPGRTDNEIKNYWNSHLRREIYRFRSCDLSTFNSLDVAKMAETSKRTSGIAKMYTKNTNPHLTSNTKNPENISRNELNIQTTTKEVDCQEGASYVPESSKETDMFTSCDFFDTLGQWEAENEGLLMQREEFELAGAIDCGKEVAISEGTDKVLLDMESTANEDINCWGWSSNSEADNLFSCSSPIISYFNSDEFCCIPDDANFWSEEEDMLLWS